MTPSSNMAVIPHHILTICCVSHWLVCVSWCKYIGIGWISYSSLQIFFIDTYVHKNISFWQATFLFPTFIFNIRRHFFAHTTLAIIRILPLLRWNRRISNSGNIIFQLLFVVGVCMTCQFNKLLPSEIYKGIQLKCKS